jgi:hypothetical protein
MASFGGQFGNLRHTYITADTGRQSRGRLQGLSGKNKPDRNCPPLGQLVLIGACKFAFILARVFLADSVPGVSCASRKIFRHLLFAGSGLLSGFLVLQRMIFPSFGWSASCRASYFRIRRHLPYYVIIGPLSKQWSTDKVEVRMYVR